MEQSLLLRTKIAFYVGHHFRHFQMSLVRQLMLFCIPTQLLSNSYREVACEHFRSVQQSHTFDWVDILEPIMRPTAMHHEGHYLDFCML